MKVGDLVRYVSYSGLPRRPARRPGMGLVFRIDIDYHGATQAYKIYKDVPRGECIRPNMVDGIGPTKRGKRDRVLVLWDCSEWEYAQSDVLEVVSESR